jgi:hypothetical protein
MNSRLRVLSTLGALAIVVSACTTGGTPAPANLALPHRPRR